MARVKKILILSSNNGRKEILLSHDANDPIGQYYDNTSSLLSSLVPADKLLIKWFSAYEELECC
jgi:hypothetical protein